MEETKVVEIKVELFIPGELKNEPIICHMIKDYDVEVKIIEASFSTESGWAYLIVTGDQQELARLFEYVRGKGITIEVKD
jgi:ABC-type methionine transport system ATPase subunit